MTTNRRQFLATSAALGAVTLFLPYQAHSAAHASGDVFTTDAGDITIHPVDHASFVMETPKGVLYVDPVGEASAYAGFPAADLIVVTHEHGDHFNLELLTVLAGADTKLLTNPAVYEKLTDDLKAKATQIGNGDNAEMMGIMIDAIPAYNITEGRENFHPKGRDNGYVMTFDGFRVYVSGDTEDIPEMRALENIDLAFVCMNLPFTMDVAAAASAVAEFGPKYVYPYHYRGRDNGTQDPQEFADLLNDEIEVKLGKWYG